MTPDNKPLRRGYACTSINTVPGISLSAIVSDPTLGPPTVFIRVSARVDDLETGRKMTIVRNSVVHRLTRERFNDMWLTACRAVAKGLGFPAPPQLWLTHLKPTFDELQAVANHRARIESIPPQSITPWDAEETTQ